MLICPRCSCIFKILEGKDLQQQAAMKIGCTSILKSFKQAFIFKYKMTIFKSGHLVEALSNCPFAGHYDGFTKNYKGKKMSTIKTPFIGSVILKYGNSF